MQVGIIGGGALGLVAGLRRLERGDQVTILERASEIGGLASSFNVGEAGAPIYLEKFYHHIFRTDTDIIRWIAAMGLSEKMVWKTPPTCTLWQGKIHRMDSLFAEINGPLASVVQPWVGTHLDTALALLHFAPLPFLDRIRFGLMGAKLKFTHSHESFAGQTAVDWARREAGPVVFDRILLPLLQGKFGDRYTEIALSWLWSRFHERTQQLGYMRGSFHTLYSAIASLFTAGGGDIRLDTTVTRMTTDNGKVRVQTAKGNIETFDRLIVTTPTNAFLDMAQNVLPEEYVTQYRGAVEHLAAHCLVLSLDRSFGNFYWLNINDSGYPFLAVIEHTQFMPPAEYNGQHLLYIGNYLKQDHPLLAQSGQEILDTFAPHLKKINPEFDRNWVHRLWSWGMKEAQPIVTRDYADQLPPHETPLPGVYLANMAHVYPQDRGQNYSIRLGEYIAGIL